MININSIISMTHKDLVKAYREIERKYKLKYKRTTNVVRQELPEFVGWVKYDRNISQASLIRAQKALEDLEYEIRFQQAKKQRQARQAKKQAKSVFSPVQAVPTPAPFYPVQTDMEWDSIIDMLNAVQAGRMSNEQKFYNPNAHHKMAGQTGRLKESNSQRIMDVLTEALSRFTAIMPEQDAKRAILDAIQQAFGGGELHYELERLSYGFYDPEYRGTGTWISTVMRIKGAIDTAYNEANK